ncbi:MAG: MFS transporter [Candidatus Nealsonbacteria bacterium]|nr:MFS transporter [Candidatus Nealsonbacteria bacterium]
MTSNQLQKSYPTLLGHPTGLFALFFAEMWERFSYYGMRALLFFYITKGFLGYGDSDAYAVYGAYTALVYMTPFFGGMLADRLLGARRAVVIGGLLMAAGHLMMTIENDLAFFTALALLICGNGFFKPNISTIVGSLYPQDSPKRDSGFTIFYMGINLGAAMSPLLCGYIGETYGYHYGFGLATIGMLTGIAVFVAPTVLTQVLIMFGAAAAAIGMFIYHPDDPFAIAVNVAVGVTLLTAGVVALVALSRGGLPAKAGGAPDEARLRRRVAGLIPLEWVVYLGTLISVPIFVLFVSGMSPLTKDKRPISLVPESTVNDLSTGKVMRAQLQESGKAVELKNDKAIVRLVERFDELHKEKKLPKPQYEALKEVTALAEAQKWDDAEARIKEAKQQFPAEKAKAILAVVLREMSKPAGLILLVCGLAAGTYLCIETFRLDKIPRERMFVVLILTFFSMLFWSFFEQAGSSVNSFTDRNVDRVTEKSRLAEEDVGQTIKMRVSPVSDDVDLMKLPLLSQEQLGHVNGNDAMKAQIEKAIRSIEEGKAEEERMKPEKLDKLVESVNRDDAFTLTGLTFLRKAAGSEKTPDELKTVDWVVTDGKVAMGVGGSEVPASIFQSVNPIYIIIFGLAFTALWAVLANYNLEPGTPVKFALGLIQLGLGFACFWYGAMTHDERGMVALAWLFLGYLFQTTGELCLSPVGLAMVTKLSPARLVSTVMGGWFLATAFSQLLAAVIAQFTGVGEGGGESVIPVPIETVNIYGDVFGLISLCAIGSGVLCLLLAPICLTRWMHSDKDTNGNDAEE